MTWGIGVVYAGPDLDETEQDRPSTPLPCHYQFRTNLHRIGMTCPGRPPTREAERLTPGCRTRQAGGPFSQTIAPRHLGRYYNLLRWPKGGLRSSPNRSQNQLAEASDK
jgi:hypothetical protein